MDAKEASMVVREYLESIKKIKFIFDVRDVEKIKDKWSIKCEIQNVFAERPITYKVRVDDKTGNILDVIEIKNGTGGD